MHLWRNFDWVLPLAMILLISLGILMIASTALGESSNYDLVIRQLVFAGIGLIVFLAASQVDLDLLRPFSVIFYAISLILLAGVLIYGLEARGSLRWIDLGAFRFQPSELVKLSTILLLAHLFASWDMKRIKNISITSAIVIVPAGLIMIQPDLGSAAILLLIWIGMLATTNFPKKIMAAGLAIGAASIPILVNYLQPYQKQRILTFLDPNADPLGTGYNIIQSTIAVGSGGLFGRGFGRGTQSHLNFLPEHHTDFIFATLAEELGLVGALILFALLGAILWRLLRSLTQVDHFGGLVLVGLFLYIFFQAAINIGMNIGLAPITGITLPFVSYGGSSLISLMLGLGIAEAIIRRRKPVEVVDD